MTIIDFAWTALLLTSATQPATAAPTVIATAAQTDEAINGFRFVSEAPITDALRRSLAAQVRIVAAARLRPEMLALFRQRPIRLVPTLGQPGVTGPNGVTLEMSLQPEDNPVLLHEFVHLYQFTRLIGTPANETVRTAYATALASGRWPARSYMLSNPREFFAMTASTLLHGRAARPPFTAAAVRQAMPDFARWIEREFRGE